MNVENDNSVNKKLIENDNYVYTKLIEKYLLYLRDPELRRRILCEANSKNLNMIRTIMKNAFDNKIVCLLELIGNPTTGKQATLRKAADDLEVDSFLLIDCRIYNTPDLIQQKIYSICGVDYQVNESEDFEEEIFYGEELDLQDEKISEQAMQDEVKSHDFWTKIFRKVFDKKKVVIYFSHIDVLCKSNRQTFLYTILDNLNMSHTKVVVAFATSHLYLMESLDRRIKSRFSAERFFFGAMIKDADEVIESIWMMNGSKGDVNSKHIAAITKYVKDPNIIKQFTRIVETEGSFDLVINVLIAFFCRMNAHLMQQLISNPKNGINIFYEYFEKAINSVITHDYKRILKSLPKCHLNLLKTILEITKDNPKAELLAFDIGAKISANRNVNHKYSPSVLLSGLNDLEKMGYIHVNKKPITGESKVTLKMYEDFIEAFQKMND